MVGRAQEIADGGTKHPGNEIAEWDRRYVEAFIWMAVAAEFVFFWILFFLGGANVIH